MPGSRSIMQALLSTEKAEEAEAWSERDLRAIFQHQLDLPIAEEVGDLAHASGRSVESVLATIGERKCLTFGDLFRAPQQDAGLLGIVKRYAKESLVAHDHLPRDVARVLYISTLVHGRSCGFAGFTSMDDRTIAREAARCLTFPWLPEEIRQLLRRGSRGGRGD